MSTETQRVDARRSVLTGTRRPELQKKDPHS